MMKFIPDKTLQLLHKDYM